MRDRDIPKDKDELKKPLSPLMEGIGKMADIAKVGSIEEVTTDITEAQKKLGVLLNEQQITELCMTYDLAKQKCNDGTGDEDAAHIFAICAVASVAVQIERENREKGIYERIDDEENGDSK